MNKEISSRVVFPKKLKHYCNLTGKTRKEICAALDIKYPTFCDWCQGKKYPRVDKIDMLAQYFSTVLGIEVRYSDLTEDKKEQPAGRELSPKRKAFIDKVMQMSDTELDRLEQILALVENTK